VNRRVRQVVERFGIPEDTFRSLAVLEDQDVIFAGTPDAMEFDVVRPMRRGIRLCRLFPYSVKPTSWAMQVLGGAATKNVISLGDDEAKTIINGGQIRKEADVEDGFVLLRWKGFTIGVGVYRRPELKSQIPRFRAVE
jgi:NOL1/NOP2/fmu family ribosome biogenesis protein